MWPLLIALQFLTCLPVRLPGMPTPEQAGRSLLFYPWVGGLFALLLGLLDTALGDASPPLQAALLLAAWVWLSGGLHLDGLADSADAWVGGFGDRERTLSIMKDPRSGPIAVVALVLVLLLKWCALWMLLGHGVVWWLVPVLGRAALLGLFLTTPYVRRGGLGQALADHLPRQAGYWVLGACLLLALGLLPGWQLVAGLVCFAWVRRLMLKRLGGCTGDTAGALLELTETTLLVAGALALG